MKHRKPSNKRLTSDRKRRKQFVIENVVKRGSSPTVTAVRGWMWRVAKIVILLALVGGVCFGANEGWGKLFWRNPNYALRQFRFINDGLLTREEAIQITRLHPGRNIYSYSLDAARKALKTLPQIETVEVTRYLPDTIEVKVTERKPVAWVSAKTGDERAKPARSHLMDSSGIIFQPSKMAPEFDSLPSLRGVEFGDLEPGKPILKAEVVAALNLVHRGSNLGAFKLDSIDVSKGCYLVVTDQRQSRLIFGLDEIPQQLERLKAVHREVEQMGQEIQTINLIPKVNVPVTLKPPARIEPEESTAPEPARPERTRDAGGARAPGPAPLKEKATPPARKATPPKPPESPGKGRTNFTKRFQAA